LFAPYRIKQLLEECSADGPVNEIFTGASLAAFKFTSDEKVAHQTIKTIRSKLMQEGIDWEKLKSILVTIEGYDPDILKTQGALPLAHLRILLAYTEITADEDGIDKAIDRARADIRSQQLQSLGAPLTHLAVKAVRPDKARFGNILPATEQFPVPTDLQDNGLERKAWMSASVAARRTFGRLMRQYFYRAELKDAKYEADFVNTVDHIAGGLPNGTTIKEAVHNKVAVVHIDGNQFTKIRQRTRLETAGEHRLTTFAKKLREYQQGNFLRPMIGWLTDQRASSTGKERLTRVINDHDLREDSQHEVEAFRFETLLWGGDEMVFVMPSWIALWWAQMFFDQWAKDWTMPVHGEGATETLTHAMGIVICDRRTPLRQARAMAEALCNAAKSVPGDSPADAVQIEVFESVDLPDSAAGLAEYRRTRYIAPEKKEDKDEKEASLFTLTPTELRDLPGLIAALEHDETGLPRSQAYRQLHSLRDQGALSHDNTINTIKSVFKAYLAAAGKGREGGIKALADWGGDRPAGLTLALLTHYWDYVDPFGDGWPRDGKTPGTGEAAA
jgi:hypothetical protein